MLTMDLKFAHALAAFLSECFTEMEIWIKYTQIFIPVHLPNLMMGLILGSRKT